MDGKFPFPFPPYPIQQELMTKIYDCISNSNMGLFESPTGTGKSLSVICSTMHWLRQKEAEVLEAQLVEKSKSQAATVSSEDDWLAAFNISYKQKTANKANEVKFKALDDYDALKKRLAKLVAQNYSSNSINTSSASRTKYYGASANANANTFGVSNSFGSASAGTSAVCSQPSETELEAEWEEFALDDRGSYDDSDSDSDCDRKESQSSGKLNQFDGSNSSIDALELPQIIYCSRTHSQIAQFMNEIKKTVFKDLRCVVIGSRKNLCINPHVNRGTGSGSNSDALVNEKCLEMQKSKSKSRTDRQNDMSVASTVDSYTEATGSISAGGLASSATYTAGKRKSGEVSRSIAGAVATAVSAGPCKYLNRTKMAACSDASLTTIMDIEEVITLAKTHQSCPYYASRGALQNGSPQVLCVPYNMLLHRDIRASVGIRLHKNTVVIVDEAHNLVDAIGNIYSCEVTQLHLDRSEEALKLYLDRYRTQLNGRNLYHINVLSSIVSSLKSHLQSSRRRGTSTTTSTNAGTTTVNSGASLAPASEDTGSRGLAEQLETEILSPNELVFQLKLDNINIVQLTGYLDGLHAVNKIGGYAESCHKRFMAAAVTASTNQQHAPAKVNYIAAIRSVLEFVSKLMNSDRACKIVVKRGRPLSTPNLPAASTNAGAKGSTSNSSYSFLLLDPSVCFDDLVEQCRSVLLLGGTLQPFELVSQQLFPRYLSAAKDVDDKGSATAALSVRRHYHLDTYSCGHIVPPNHVLTLALGTSSRHPFRELTFTHATSNSTVLLDDLYCTVADISNRVPHGVIVFFSSYAYMDKVTAVWTRRQRQQQHGSFDSQGSSQQGSSQDSGCYIKKPLFVEQRGSAADADRNTDSSDGDSSGSVFSQYASKAIGPTGALLCCVMNGKLSEGINFSDNLARCVIVVGLPYPNKFDVILQEKINFMCQAKLQAQSADRLGDHEQSMAISAVAAAAQSHAFASQVYENMCMKAINQSIGRSIRHIGDYSAIVVLDKRYCSASGSSSRMSVVDQLPKWTTENGRLKICDSFAQAWSELSSFYKLHDNEQSGI